MLAGSTETEVVAYLLPAKGDLALRLRQAEIRDYSALGPDAGSSQRQNFETLLRLLASGAGVERDDVLARNALVLKAPLELVGGNTLEAEGEALLDVYARLLRARWRAALPGSSSEVG